ncbi:oligosaccharide flippase family protein [Microbacterium sp. ET2]|uniref:lipopolysaccharide biosynthesis protein n=1 Tax=Microbacterium albipurpureum TaxID=3050384 RepID=UPI00259CBBCF|nr:oligosaccharide flippase family protein [Microbacterium sp. ET2 (Ac-2212)]WJL94755.1 oligosaccharide flippase family protein [Microbacterium sp. ET2 (Ac-2212)]
MVLRRFRRFLGTGPARNLILGQLIGQLAMLASLPFLTRLLAPEEMGVYQFALSLAIVLQPLATLRRELVIPFGDSREARQERRTGLVASALLVCLILLFGSVTWAIGADTISIGAVSTAMLLASLSLTYIENAYLIRLNAQRRLAARNLVGGVGCALLQVVAAFYFGGALAVAFAYLIGRVIATAVTITRAPTIDEVAATGKAPRRHRFSAILSGMIAAASSQVIVMGSTLALGAAGGAQVAVAQRVAATPVSLISQGLMQVTLGAVAPLIREGNPGVTKKLREQTLRLTAFSILVVASLAVGGPLLAGPVLGPEWVDAGVLIAVFALPLGLMLVALPGTTLLVPLGKERLLMMLQSARLVAIVVTFLIAGSLTNSILVTSIFASITWVLAYIPLMIAAFAASAEHDRDQGGPQRAG